MSTQNIEDRLEELGISLPETSWPVANYVPFVVTGNLVFISGQVPMAGSSMLLTGKVGAEVSQDQAHSAARICGLQILAHLKAACDGDLGRVKRIVRIGGFVNCVEGFGGQPEIINGASDLMVEVFGDAGKHARAAVGVNALPRDVPVEVDAIAEIS